MKSLIVVAVFCAVVFVGTARSNANPIIFVAQLNGASENPPNASPGTGFARVTIDAIANTMFVQVTFQDLVAPNTASHIHAPTALPFTGVAGVATTVPTFTGFPGGVVSGSYSHLFDMTDPASYNPAFITANGGTTASAEAALFSAIMSGRAYLNIHSGAFPGGEIRGFLAPVPEPTTMLLFGSGLASVVYKLRRKRKTQVN